MFLGCVLNSHSQETFNVSETNPFLFNGGGVGLSVFGIENVVYTFGFLAAEDSLGAGLIFKYNFQGEALDTIRIDSPIDSLNVNIGRFGCAQFDAGKEVFYLPFLEANKFVTDTTKQHQNSILILQLNGDTTKIEHEIVDNFSYNFFQIRKWGEHFYACGQVAGDTMEFLDPDGAHGFLMKMDTLGNQVWVQHYENSWKIDYMDISEDGEFVLGSSDFDIGGPFSIQNMVIRTDAFGNEKWRYIFGGDYEQHFTPAEFSNDGHVLAVGSNGNESDLATPLRILKIADMETFGQILIDQEYYYVSQRPATAYSIIEDEFGNVFTGGLIVGENDQGVQHRYGALMKFNSELDSIWFRTYTHYAESDHWHIIRDISFAEDGGFVMTGYAEEGSDAPVPLLDHIWTLKVDEHGCLEPGCEVVGTEEIVIGLQDAMKVFPNPVQDVLTIEWNIDPIRTPSVVEGQGSGFQMIILNSLGQIVQTVNLSPNDLSTIYQINLSTQAKGLYTIHWMNGSAWYDSVKFAKE